MRIFARRIVASFAASRWDYAPSYDIDWRGGGPNDFAPLLSKKGGGGGAQKEEELVLSSSIQSTRSQRMEEGEEEGDFPFGLFLLLGKCVSICEALGRHSFCLDS